MLTLEMIIAMLAWPTLATALVLGIGWVPAVARSRAAVLVAPVAITVGFLVGYFVVAGMPDLMPALDAKARLPHIALMGLGIAMVGASTGPRLRWAAVLLGSVLAIRLLLGAAIEFQWTTSEAAIRVLVLAAGLGAAILLASDFIKQLPTKTGSLGLAAIAGVAAPIMLFSDSLLMAQLHGVLGISVGIAVVGTWISPTRISLTAAAPVIVAIAWSHWVIGLLFANMPLASFVLLAAAIPAAALASRAFKGWTPRRHALASLLALGVFVIGALALGGLRYSSSAATDASSTSDSDTNYGYYE